MKKVLYLLFCMALATSCTIEKRTHLSGYHIDFKKSRKHVANAVEKDKQDASRNISFLDKREPILLNTDHIALSETKDLPANRPISLEEIIELKSLPSSPTSLASSSGHTYSQLSTKKKSRLIKQALRVLNEEPEGDEYDAMLFGAVGLVFSILGLLLCWIPLLGWLFGGLGLILGYVGLQKKPASKGQVLAAMVIGGLAFAFSTGFFLLALLILL